MLFVETCLQRYAEGITFPPGTSTTKCTICESTVLCLQTRSLAALCFATAPLRPFSPIAIFQMDYINDCNLLIFFTGCVPRVLFTLVSANLSPYSHQSWTLFETASKFPCLGLKLSFFQNAYAHTQTKSIWKSGCFSHFVQAINILQREYPGRTVERCSEFLMAIKMY